MYPAVDFLQPCWVMSERVFSLIPTGFHSRSMLAHDKIHVNIYIYCFYLFMIHVYLLRVYKYSCITFYIHACIHPCMHAYRHTYMHISTRWCDRNQPAKSSCLSSTTSQPAPCFFAPRSYRRLCKEPKESLDQWGCFILGRLQKVTLCSCW